MIRAEQCLTGTLTTAPPGLTLLVPRTNYEQSLLIVKSEGANTAIFLDGSHVFEGFSFDVSDNWKGLLIPDVYIEMDEQSCFDVEHEDVPNGSVIREHDRLAIAVRMDDEYRMRRQQRLALFTGLIASSPRMGTGFQRWQVVLGMGIEKRILRTIDVKV